MTQKVVHLEIISEQAKDLEQLFRTKNSEYTDLRGLNITTKVHFVYNIKIVYLYLVDLRARDPNTVRKFLEWAEGLKEREPVSQVLLILPKEMVRFPSTINLKEILSRVRYDCRRIPEFGRTWHHRCVIKSFVLIPEIRENKDWYAVSECKDTIIECEFEKALIELTLLLLELST